MTAREPLSLPEQAMPIARTVAGPDAPRPDVPDAVVAALTRAIDAGHAEVYMSGGGKIEFTDTGFQAWCLAETAEIERQVRECVAAEIEAEHWQQSRIGKDATPLLTAARIARGES